MPSGPIRFKRSEIFLYTSPTNGASGPNIIPSNNATETIGTNTSVTLLKKSFVEFKIVLYFILFSKKGHEDPSYYKLTY